MNIMIIRYLSMSSSSDSSVFGTLLSTSLKMESSNGSNAVATAAHGPVK